MLDAFWSGVGEELARRWVARVLTPALAFWVGGLSLLWWDVHRAGVAASGWVAEITRTAEQLGRLPVLVQGALVVGGLVVVAASAVVAERLTVPVLRFLEGYWARPQWLRRRMVTHRQRRYEKARNRARSLQLRQRRGRLSVAEYAELRQLRQDPARDPQRRTELESAAADALTAQEATQLGKDLQWLRTTPDRDELRMPTRLGDALRAAERRPVTSYGMDAVVCWNALWHTLPQQARTELSQARAALDTAARGWLWGVLFLVWTPLSWWAVPIGVLIPVVSYWFGIVPRGIAFGRLIVTCYDLYRFNLYDALHLPRPESPEQERTKAGPRVTAALWGTLAEAGLRYRFDPVPESPVNNDPPPAIQVL
ncbi:hypothetical protein [Gandjariella thermophila]|uniref:Uncharacterized protein n=1 Tax=Gandjariella thermophila TaxID=1931992 RepID=A0A4D4JH26_9PSEU|nr:hypothetical protein [Gandjariella thermophila]GDY33938.1 hypothetical protein GTS_55710 [Gandjariella thermophila]